MPPKKTKAAAAKASSKRAADADPESSAPSKQAKTKEEGTVADQQAQQQKPTPHDKPIEETAVDEDEEASDPSFDFNSPISITAERFVDDPESQSVLRVLVTFNEAIAIIGPSGKSMNDQAKEAVVKVDITGRELGAVERMLVVAGPSSGIAKYCSLVVNRQMQKFKAEAIRLRVLVPAALLSSIVGTQANTLKQIMGKSGATLAVVAVVLPQSTDRLLSVTGNAEAVNTAVDMVTASMIENRDKLKTVPAIPYYPVPVYGKFGHPRLLNSERVRRAALMTSHNPYGVRSNQEVTSNAQSDYNNLPSQQQQQGQEQLSQPLAGVVGPSSGTQAPISGPVGPGGQIQQQIFIPNDMVGAIIGKGGMKINEIRSMSGSHM